MSHHCGRTSADASSISVALACQSDPVLEGHEKRLGLSQRSTTNGSWASWCFLFDNPRNPGGDSSRELIHPRAFHFFFSKITRIICIICCLLNGQTVLAHTSCVPIRPIGCLSNPLANGYKKCTRTFCMQSRKEDLSRLHAHWCTFATPCNPIRDTLSPGDF